MRAFVLFAALALATPAVAEDDLEMAPAAGQEMVAPAAGGLSAADMAVAKSVAKQIAGQYRLTPEKRKELGKLAKEQQQIMAPHMKSMAKAAEAFAKDPKFQADMQRFGRDMQAMMARQLPQLLAAMQPLIQEALPSLLEAQAKALRTLTVPTPVDPYEDK